jgi:hypothetical protein
VAQAPVCIVHGDLHTGNILLADGQPYLIDFADCGPGPPFADFAKLEVSMRYGLMYRDRKIDDCLRTEELLLSPPLFLPKSRSDVCYSRAWDVTMDIRGIALNLLGHIGDADHWYASALFLALLKLAGIEKLSTEERRGHSLQRRRMAYDAASFIAQEWRLG